MNHVGWVLASVGFRHSYLMYCWLLIVTIYMVVPNVVSLVCFKLTSNESMIGLSIMHRQSLISLLLM